MAGFHVFREAHMEPLYRRGDRWIEHAPEHCGNMHPLKPGHVLVGSRNCHCGIMHRTHTCRRCDNTVYTPPLTGNCQPHDGGRSTYDWGSTAVDES